MVAQCMRLCLLLFTQLSLKIEPSESKTADKKSEFYMKKVILGHSFCNQLHLRQRIAYRYIIMLALTLATEIAENCRRRQPH